MRPRHNIVGSEVGRERPPIYFRSSAGGGRRRRRGGLAATLAWLALVILAAVLATWAAGAWSG